MEQPPWPSSCTPVLALYAVVFQYLVAFPLLDDFQAILGFLVRQQALQSLPARVALCFTDQQAEYKFIFLHLLLTLQHSLFGHISFLSLLVLGNLPFLPILYCILKNSFTETPWPNRAILLLPISLLLCQLTFAELFNWAMASLSALAVVSFSVLTLHCLLQPKRWKFALACAFLTLACLSATNGFFLVPVGAALLWSVNRRRATLCWFALSLALTAGYLASYHRVLQPPGLPVAQRLLFFFSFAGGGVENMHRSPVHGAAIVLGICLVGVVTHALLTRYVRSNPFAMGMASWVLLSAATVAALRTYLGFEQSLSGRYKIYCTLLLVFAYTYLADQVRHSSITPARKALLWRGALFIAVAFYAAGMLAGTAFLRKRHDMLVAGRQQYLADPAHNVPDVMPDAPPGLAEALGQSWRQLLSQAIAEGILVPPPAPAPRHLP